MTKAETGVPFFTSLESITGALSIILIRLIGLVHKKSNTLGQGMIGARPGGLTVWV